VNKPINYFLEREILRKIEVCEMIGCSLRTLHNYVKFKGLPIHRVQGANPYFLASEIMKWIKES